jgi:hypothetical protein
MAPRGSDAEGGSLAPCSSVEPAPSSSSSSSPWSSVAIALPAAAAAPPRADAPPPPLVAPPLAAPPPVPPPLATNAITASSSGPRAGVVPAAAWPAGGGGGGRPAAMTAAGKGGVAPGPPLPSELEWPTNSACVWVVVGGCWFLRVEVRRVIWRMQSGDDAKCLLLCWGSKGGGGGGPLPLPLPSSPVVPGPQPHLQPGARGRFEGARPEAPQIAAVVVPFTHQRVHRGLHARLMRRVPSRPLLKIPSCASFFPPLARGQGALSRPRCATWRAPGEGLFGAPRAPNRSRGAPRGAGLLGGCVREKREKRGRRWIRPLSSLYE